MPGWLAARDGSARVRRLLYSMVYHQLDSMAFSMVYCINDISHHCYIPCDISVFIMWYPMVYYGTGISHVCDIPCYMVMWYGMLYHIHDISHHCDIQWYITYIYTMIYIIKVLLYHITLPSSSHVISHFLCNHITWYITLTWTLITPDITKVWYITFWVWYHTSAPSRWPADSASSKEMTSRDPRTDCEP